LLVVTSNNGHKWSETSETDSEWLAQRQHAEIELALAAGSQKQQKEKISNGS